MATENAPVRVRFSTGETDVMPLDMAEYVLMRFYNKRRAIFAGFMRDFYLDREGGPGADRDPAPRVPGRGPGRPRREQPDTPFAGGPG
jgi:hypothetical protein